MKCYLIAMFVALTLATNLNAQTFSTEFGTNDGFVTGGTADVVLPGGLVTFSGGQQQQSFLGAAYNNGNAAYLFINGANGFNGAASTGDIGEIIFGGGGATSVSFHAANLANGAATTFTSFDKFVYALRNERSEKIGYVGRDLAFDDKLRKWEDSNRTKQRPVKAKFPPGFARGSFLYGAEVSRMESESARAQLKAFGILVVEGMNDCAALDSHGILAVALCSNRISEGQSRKLIRWSKQVGNGKITLMLDNDEEGWQGTQDSIEKLAAFSHIATIWTPEKLNGKFNRLQPEQLNEEELAILFGNFT